MKYWKSYNERDSTNSINLINPDGDIYSRILSLSIMKNKKIRFMEKCDNYFHVLASKDEAIEILQEAIAWIKKQ